jgi:hypothetical protein
MKGRCETCKNPLTWESQRKQYMRLIKRGWSEDRAKAAMPKCQKCVTRMLRSACPTPGDGG